MKEVSEIIGWIAGGLATLGFFNYKNKLKTDDERFASLFAGQRALETDVAALSAMANNTAKALDELHRQGEDTGRNITDIKISIARLPKRDKDTVN